MRAKWMAGHVQRRVIATAVMVVSTAVPARAQVGFGITLPGGTPFLYYTPRSVPSPTQYLYDLDRARISAYSNAARQRAAARSVTSMYVSPDAYYEHARGGSGRTTHDARSRPKLSQPASPVPEAAAPRPTGLPLDAFFLGNGTLDWPHDAPDSAELHSLRVEAESAIKLVREELRLSGQAKAQSVDEARRKLVNYGQRALAEIKSTRSRSVEVTLHYFLLFLNQSLDQVALAGTS